MQSQFNDRPAKMISSRTGAKIVKINPLQEAKVNIFNTVKIFDGEKEIVYRDACCHYNMIGQRILEKYIADSIKTIMEKKDIN